MRENSIPKFEGSIFFFFSISYKKYCPSPCLMPLKKINMMKTSFSLEHMHKCSRTENMKEKKNIDPT